MLVKLKYLHLNSIQVWPELLSLRKVEMYVYACSMEHYDLKVAHPAEIFLEISLNPIKRQT